MRILVITIILSFLSGHTSITAMNSSVSADTISQDAGYTVPLPEVPGTLRNPSERADYILQHFWDKLNIAQIVVPENQEAFEQAFSNFISVFPFASDNIILEGSIKRLINISQSDSILKDLMFDITERYLRDQESPIRNDEYYLLFAKEWEQLPDMTFTQKERLKYNTEMASINLPGNTANDFTFLLSDDTTTSLKNFGHNDYLLIMFYDPGCDRCMRTKEVLSNDAILNKLIDNGTLEVLAVAIDVEKPEWKESIETLPNKWTKGYDDGQIWMENSYELVSLPSLYLVDKSNKVILKDVMVNTLIDFFKTLGQ